MKKRPGLAHLKKKYILSFELIPLVLKCKVALTYDDH